jgi:hypothetical protein
MKILYISAASGPDYQCDMLFHGLRTLLGSDVVDSKKIPYMYKDYSNTHKFEDLYGKGFSLYGLLENADVDRDDLVSKIQSKFYDVIIYGSIHRSQEFISVVLENYEPRNIFFVDGEDESDQIFWPLVGRGHYLKREYCSSSNLITPIQFAIPYEKVALEGIDKTQQFAKIDPRDKSTYIYSQESDYYHDYRSSLFAYTTKKAGWDCLRHYEIMANDSIPIFIDLNQCPIGTMQFFPRMEIFGANALLLQNGVEFFQTDQGVEIWTRIQSQIKKYLLSNLTTIALANRVLTSWKLSNQ